jgi:hypothetical protein
MTQSFTPEQILAAARVLDRELRGHGHLVQYPTYEEMLANDPIGAEEWGGTIERMLPQTEGDIKNYEFAYNQISLRN